MLGVVVHERKNTSRNGYLPSVKTEDGVRPGAIFRPYGRKNGRRKRYLPSIWTKDCVSRHYFPSAET